MMRNEQLGGIHMYSTMMAENLMGTSNACPSGQPPSIEEKHRDSQQKRVMKKQWMEDLWNYLQRLIQTHTEMKQDATEADDDYDVTSEDEVVGYFYFSFLYFPFLW
ncbi:hypothetical protein BVRB_016090 [Beta vulgaris subsp. vulgaris]|uniref:Uncharacterized protein n=1 Tax=Beta vulgaris subsp. vulgaris TaxID=3555 RepID=A0A0J8B4B9_BETVV|nr:hypothetical protein BVRB_016090 [Beta vulgaris subsp. vulgaris]